MNLQIEIRRNADGVVAIDVWEDCTFGASMWEWGNYSCDCNRELFFSRAMSEDDPDGCACGDERYAVRLRDADTGDVLYDELGEVG